MTSFRPFLLLGPLTWATTALADEPRPAITLRLDHPDRQLKAILDLFQGSRAPNPAAALAGWKRASREPNRLGKPLEALIAAFNPAMAEEIRTLDGAGLALWFDPADGRPAWGATLPGDDGSFAALATSLVLSGGAAEGPMEGLAVDRLGPPGSPLMARAPRALLVGGSPEGLKEARIRSDRPADRGQGSRVWFSVDPAALDGATSAPIRRFRVALREARGPVSGSTHLAGSTLMAGLNIPLDPVARPAAIDPTWLDGLPTDRTMALFAIALDPTPANWDAAFRVADRVEKVDPARENLAPLRLRLDLLARTLGLRTDGDLLPHLKGISGWMGGDGRAVDRACLTLHLDDEAAAGRIFDRVKPLPNTGPPPGLKADAGRWLGLVEGGPIFLQRAGRSIVATWGDGVKPASVDLRDHPERSARAIFANRPADASPAFVAAIWPARVPGFIPPETPLAFAVAGAPPVTWSGSWEKPGSFRLVGAWPGLDATVRRFLDRIPLDPPPDH